MTTEPTPRTDAAVIPNADFDDWGVGDSPYVHAEFARQLETELNLAVQENERLKKHLSVNHFGLGVCIQERDTFKQEIEKLKQDLKDMTWLRDESNQAYEQACKERDSFREKAEQWDAIQVALEQLRYCKKALLARSSVQQEAEWQAKAEAFDLLDKTLLSAINRKKENK